MKKKITLALSVLCILALVIALASCGEHEHSADSSWKNDDTNHWNVCVADDGTCTEKLNSAAHTFEKDTVDATCTETGLITETCTVCGYEKETEIPVLAHDYNEATCTLPKSCKVCGIVEGEALGHSGGTATCEAQAICDSCNQPYGDWGDHVGGKATCRSKAVCSVCRASYGELGDHDFADATCLAPKTCRHCGETEGEPAGHSGGTATCTEAAKCASCGENYGEPAGHKGGTATCTEAAVCEVCNESYGGPKGHKGGQLSCTEKPVCEVCNEPYGDPIHTSENGICKNCGVKLSILGADAVESAIPSHDGGGAANVDKLFDGDKTTTGIWTYGDKEYAPAVNGDSIVITLKEETIVLEVILWGCGNYSKLKIEFMDEFNNVVYSKELIYDCGDANGGNSGANYVVLNGLEVKSIKMTALELKWDEGKTGKTSEIEIVSNIPMTE